MQKSRQRLAIFRRQRPAVLLAGLVVTALLVVVALMVQPPATVGSPARDDVPQQVPPRRFATEVDESVFLRGNIHTHSLRSDGDSPAEVVMAWYRDHGYDFLALTDHNRHLDVSDYQHIENGSFVLIPGEEVSMAAAGKPIHVNALCTHSTIGEARFDSRTAAVQWAVDQIGSQGGVALINHPNFVWSLRLEHLAPIRGAHMIEVYSGHPHARSHGDDRHDSVEQMWGELVALGSRWAPAAVDDMHQLGPVPTEGVPQARPGTGWVEVYGAELDADSICSALGAGRLYATNGPQLSRLAVGGDAMTVWLDDADAQVDFVDIGGEALASAHPEPDSTGKLHASYQLRGDEPLVRAR